MLYFANPSTPSIREAMLDEANYLGMISTRSQGFGRPPPGVEWCADNECFAAKRFDETKFYTWLATFTPNQIKQCRFAVAPDVVGDATATLHRFKYAAERIKRIGFPVALVGQDGQESLMDDVPWSLVDAWFTGGSTDWKLSTEALACMTEAKRRGKWCHMGRVNSYKRADLAFLDGYDSVDGTYLAFGPDINLPKLVYWMRSINSQATLPLYPTTHNR